MGQQTIPNLKDKFADGKTPTGSDFADVFDSYIHKGTKIEQSQILGLADSFSSVASREDLANVVSGLNPMGDAQDLQDIETKPKRNNDAYFVLDQLDGNGDPYVFRFDAELDEWINTKQVVFKDVAKKSDIAQLAVETTAKMSMQVHIKTGKNLIDDNSSLKGYYINYNGDLAENENYRVSPLVPVSSNKDYVLNFVNGTYLVEYDKNLNKQNVVKIDTLSDRVLHTTDNTTYIRLSLSSNNSNVQLEEGVESTSYEPFVLLHKIISDDYISEDKLSEKVLQCIQPTNLYKPDEALDGYYLNIAGIPTANSGYIVSNYIPGLPGMTVISQQQSEGVYSVAYDAYKRIARIVIGSKFITLLDNERYCRLTLSKSLIESDTPMIAYGTHILPYHPVATGYKIWKELLPGVGESDVILPFHNDIALPSKLYFLQGVNYDLFAEPLKMFKNRDNLWFSTSGFTAIRNLKRTVKVTPNDNNSITTRLYDENYDLRITKVATAIVATPGIGTNEIKVQIIGDSYTNGQFYKNALLSQTSGYVPNLKMIGLRKYTGSGYNVGYDEGRGGWELSDYFEIKKSDGFDANGNNYAGFWQPDGSLRYWGCVEFWQIAKGGSGTPGYSSGIHGRYNDQLHRYGDDGYLVNPTTDDMMWSISANSLHKWNGEMWSNVNEADYSWSFQYEKYLQMFDFDAPDMLFVMLGVNDFTYTRLGHDEWVNNMEIVNASYKAANPNGKFVAVIHCTTTGSPVNNSGRQTDIHDVNLFYYRKNIINRFGDRENEGIYLVDAGIMVDEVYGYPYSTDEAYTLPFEGYSGTERIAVQTQNPHPTLSYSAMGLPIAAFIQKYR